MDLESQKKHWIWMALLFAAGLIIYSNAWNVPFQFDDYKNIVQNSSLRGRSDIWSIWNANSKTRFLPFLSFADNLVLDRTHVFGHHLINIALHIFNSVWVYFLVLLLGATPKMRGSCSRETVADLAGLSALIFLCHPLQTQAVTYIVQRMASMAAFFYLGALVFYLKARYDEDKVYYIAAWGMTLAAMFCKENAFTLPLALVMVEGLCFGFDDGKKRTFFRLLPFLVTLMIIPVLVYAGHWSDIFRDKFLPTGKNVASRTDYFFTELNVLCTYLRLFFFPINQNVDYDYPIAHSLVETKTFICLFLLTGLFVYAFWLRRKNSLVAFSIFWFFLTLSVESSVIPISDVIFEHRMYLPLAGCAIFLSVALRGLFKKRSYFLFAGILIVLVFSGMTYARNRVWGTEMSLWEDVIRKSPEKARGYNNMGGLYCLMGREKEGWALYEKAFQKDSRYVPAVYNLAVAREHEGKIDQALVLYQRALEFSPNFIVAYDHLGLAYQKSGDFKKASESFEKAIRVSPRYSEAYKHLGILLKKMGDRKQAIIFLRKSLQLNPRDKEAARELYKVYMRQEN